MTRNASEFSEYDFFLAIDRSGSMGGAAKGFNSRWAQAKEITEGVATFASQVNDDGITVITFGGNFVPTRDVVSGVKADSVHALFEKSQPAGSTPLHLALDAAFAKHFSSTKKTLLAVVTDGEPDDKEAVAKSIVNAAGKLADATQIRVIFLQVGDDAAASHYLDDLDNHLSAAKFDIVNAITFQEANGVTVPDLLSRALDDTH